MAKQRKEESYTLTADQKKFLEKVVGVLLAESLTNALVNDSGELSSIRLCDSTKSYYGLLAGATFRHYEDKLEVSINITNGLDEDPDKQAKITDQNQKALVQGRAYAEEAKRILSELLDRAEIPGAKRSTSTGIEKSENRYFLQTGRAELPAEFAEKLLQANYDRLKELGMMPTPDEAAEVSSTRSSRRKTKRDTEK